MARPAGRPIAIRGEHSRSERRGPCSLTGIEPQQPHDRVVRGRTRQLSDLWTARRVAVASQLTLDNVEGVLMTLRERGLAPQMVRGFAQVPKRCAATGIAKDSLPQTSRATFSSALSSRR
jgi:hypothetical protein